MKIENKLCIWWLTFPFAHPTSGVFTTIWTTIYMPRGWSTVPEDIERHEKIHSEQQKSWTVFGLPLWLLLYLFALPVFFNPFRFRWEFQAYIEGSKVDQAEAFRLLSSKSYGWLWPPIHKWAIMGLKRA